MMSGSPVPPSRGLVAEPDMERLMPRHAPLLALLLIGLLAQASRAQEPRRSARPDPPGVVSRIEWSEDGETLSFTNQGRRYRLDLETLEREELGEDEGRGGRSAPDAERRRRFFQSRRGARGASTGDYVGRPSRGRQYTQVDSPDGKWEAHCRDWNVVLEHKETDEVVPVTVEGNQRIAYGTASWVYGEELDQNRAMWWTPDSTKLLYYRFDNTGVEPFHLITGWSRVNTDHYPEYYPKAGAQNPAAEVWVYDLASRKTTRIDVGGSPEEYLYNLQASPDGSLMMLSWTDRLQHDLKVLALDLDSGDCRTIVAEHQDTWQSNRPTMRYLADQRRFLWRSERSGYSHFELRDLDGRLHCDLTPAELQVSGIQLVDEEAGLVGYTAYSAAENPYYLQYHLVGLDGEGERRVTVLDYHHSSFDLSPDREWLVARYEEVNTPPSTALYRTDGSLACLLAESNPEERADLAEMFSFPSSDGRFDIYGILYKPKDFDPERSYPLMNSLYGGPGSNEFSMRYVSSERDECKRGYLVVKVNNRGTANRGKEFLGAVYGKLGDVDIQDHADAVRLLRERPYVDGNRVGIAGHSYGGFMAIMGIFKHPDVYAAAVAGAGLSDWRNYDTIYTERYMSTPQLNPEGYDVGRAMTYVEGFKGKLLLLHGMVDDNVHPTNAFQLIAALDEAGKPYESRFWPDGGHGLGKGSSQAKWEFLDRVLKPEER